MASFNKILWFLRTSSSTNSESTKDGYLSPKGRITIGDKFHHFPLYQLQLIDLYTLFSLGLIPPLGPVPGPRAAAIMHLTYILSDRLINSYCFSPGLGSGTFPLGDLYWSPYLTLEPSLIHQLHWMNCDRECLSLKTGSQPLHLKRKKKAINRVWFPSVSVASFFTYWCFYCCHAGCLSQGEWYSRRHQLSAC